MTMKYTFFWLSTLLALSGCSASESSDGGGGSGGAIESGGNAGVSSGGNSGSGGAATSGGSSSGVAGSVAGGAGSGGAGQSSGAGGTSTGGVSAGGAAGTGSAGTGSAGAAGASTCPSKPWHDPTANERKQCAFVAGDHTDKTQAISATQRAKFPIKHVIVMMKENRSFDHLFGGLKALQPDADVADDGFFNLDKQGNKVGRFHSPTTCIGFDPDHQWNAMHAQVNGGKMDGFVKSAASGSDGHFVMGYYEQKDLPFDYFLANTFAIADRYFAPVRSGTFPNRDYLLLGTSDTVDSTQYSVWPSPEQPSIFDLLDAAKVSWGVYGDDHPLEETLNIPSKSFEKTRPWQPVAKLIEAFKDGTLPSVVFVDGLENRDDEHPTADLQVGEAWSKRIYDAAIASKAWQSTAMFLTYDEAGGFADHVPPPEKACLARPQDSKFFELGVRVPLIAISPWARRHYVSHIEKQHTSITRFIEALFDLPALTARDANSDALLDLFDFDCAPSPVPQAPAAGSAGCGGATLTLDKTSFGSGEPIVFHFSGGPGNELDWIGVYPRADSGPHQNSTLWDYCATSTQSAPANHIGVKSGSVTIDKNSNQANWPLLPGSSWTAYYLLNDGYASVASIEFDIHN